MTTKALMDVRRLSRVVCAYQNKEQARTVTMTSLISPNSLMPAAPEPSAAPTLAPGANSSANGTLPSHLTQIKVLESSITQSGKASTSFQGNAARVCCRGL